MMFPPKRLSSERSQICSSQSTPELRSKITRLLSRHHQMKIAYQLLKSQIDIGLLDAEEVFNSLAIPLMKLVGLKTEEMAEDGRFTTIIMDSKCSQQDVRRNDDVLKSPAISPIIAERDRDSQIRKTEGKNYAAKATIAGKELIEKQQMKMIQLVQFFKRIETQVNAHQNDIFETLANHKYSLKKFFEKAIYCISSIYGQNHDNFLFTLKLLRTIYENMGVVIGSIEGSVQDLLQDLAEQMCNPAEDYVKGLKADMRNGACMRLLVLVEEMERAMRDGRLELEEVRQRVRAAEEGKVEAMCKLKKIEENVERIKGCFASLPEAKKRSLKPFVPQEFLGMEEDNTNDDKLLWELLKQKRKYCQPESPMGPKDLMNFQPNNKRYKNSTSRPSFPLRPVRSQSRGLGPKTTRLTTLVPLGSSPSATNGKRMAF